VLFFGRYEASQFGSPVIESEHLLLGLLREDRAISPLVPLDVGEAIRKEIDHRQTLHEKLTPSIDLPLSAECKRILAFAGQEAKALNHRYIEIGHLYLGIFREEKSLAATLLQEKTLQSDSLRQEILQRKIEYS
jgi:ATP-dependent Clp protease ATP-binding subunit ClpC